MNMINPLSGINWLKLVVMQGVPAALLIFLVVLGATAFAKDLADTKAIAQATAVKVDDLNTHLELLVKIQRQTCVNTANGDRLAIAGCMVTE